ncbi:hypothetical protein ABKV19_017123, partial [Rosa sericea]
VPRNERGELECLEKLVNKYERGQIQCVDWLDRLAFKAMERIKERESSKIEVCICTWLSISVVLNIMLFSRGNCRLSRRPIRIQMEELSTRALPQKLTECPS